MAIEFKQKTALIIPAYNEVDRIQTVIKAAQHAQLIDEIIVACDGCTDGTYELVSKDQTIQCLNLQPNRGKGGAMLAGAQATDAEIVLFMDADLIGLDGKKIDSMVKPMLEDRAEMVLGVFKSGRGATDLAQVLVPYITGQRAIKRSVFLSIPDLESARMGVETAITKYVSSCGYRVEKVDLHGCTHCMKEEKLGFAKGFSSRLKMYYEIIKILADRKKYRANK